MIARAMSPTTNPGTSIHTRWNMGASVASVRSVLEQPARVLLERRAEVRAPAEEAAVPPQLDVERSREVRGSGERQARALAVEGLRRLAVAAGGELHGPDSEWLERLVVEEEAVRLVGPARLHA